MLSNPISSSRQHRPAALLNMNIELKKKKKNSWVVLKEYGKYWYGKLFMSKQNEGKFGVLFKFLF